MSRARTSLLLLFIPLTPMLLAIHLGCSDLDLGLAPFFCHKGKPECPEGYFCQEVDNQKICFKEGSVPPMADGSVDDSNGGFDYTIDGQPPILDGPPQDTQNPSSPTVAITEFLANPKAVSDTDGEWVELYNLSDMPVDINGWLLRDNDSDAHIIVAGGPLVIPSKGYLLLGRNTDASQNGGVSVSYAYSDFFMANTADEIILEDSSGQPVDRVAYSANEGFSIPDGHSLSVRDPTADKNQPSNWCEELNPWSGSSGDAGTPGAPPGC